MANKVNSVGLQADRVANRVNSVGPQADHMANRVNFVGSILRNQRADFFFQTEKIKSNL